MPNSSSCCLKGIFTDTNNYDFLKIAVVSVPEKGRANQELLSLLAKKIKVAKSQCQIISGELDRYKKIKIVANPVEIEQNLNDWIKNEG